MPWGLAIGAAGGIISSIFGSKKAKQQTDTVNYAQMAAVEEQRKALAAARTDLSPYMGTGQNALMQAGNAAGVNGTPGYDAALTAFHASPDYQYQLGEGTRAVEASASALGFTHSGATLKAVQDRAMNLANADFGNYYNRLSGLAGAGQQAATSLGGFGTGTAQGIAQTDTSAATAKANILGQQSQGLGNAIGNFSNNAAYALRRNSLYNGNDNNSGIFGAGSTAGTGNFGLSDLGSNGSAWGS